MGVNVWLVEIVTRPDYTNWVWNVVESLEDAVDSAFEYFYTSAYSAYSGSWASEPELQPNGDYLVHIFASDGYYIAYLELAHWEKE